MAQSVYDDLARRVLAHGLTKGDLETLGFTYRKGKTFADVTLAVTRGADAGRGKFENEICAISSRLSRVLKQRRVCKGGP